MCCRYVINVHQKGSSGAADENVAGEIEVEKLKKYIAYARARCFPRLSADAAESLRNYYVKVRSEMKTERSSHKVTPILRSASYDSRVVY